VDKSSGEAVSDTFDDADLSEDPS